MMSAPTSQVGKRLILESSNNNSVLLAFSLQSSSLGSVCGRMDMITAYQRVGAGFDSEAYRSTQP